MNKKVTYSISILIIIIIAIIIYETNGKKATKVQAAQGADITIALPGTSATLDPQDAQITIDMSIAKSTYQGLFKFNSKMEVTPDLATEYKVDKTAKVYTVTLKDNIKFADGTPFNADAVKVNFDRQMNNHLKRHSLVSNIEKVEVIDPKTVKFTLKTAFNSFINSLAHPSQVIISPTALAKYKDTISQHPVGTGQFMFKEWVHGDHITFVPNPYYNGPKTNIHSIIYKGVPESGSRASMMISGQAQWTMLSPEIMNKVKANQKVEVSQVPSLIARYYAINMLSKAFKDTRVRKALNYAFNKDTFIKVVFQGNSIVLKSIFPDSIETFKEQPAYSYNIAKAKQLLKEAGYPNGFPVVIWAKNNSISLRSAQFTQQQLAQVGIKATIVPRDTASHYAVAEHIGDPKNRDKNILIEGGWSSSVATADWAIRPLFASTAEGVSNFGKYKNLEVDKKIYAAKQTLDPDEKVKLYQDIQASIWNDAPWIFTGIDTIIIAKDKKLHGFVFLPDESFAIDNLQYK